MGVWRFDEAQKSGSAVFADKAAPAWARATGLLHTGAKPLLALVLVELVVGITWLVIVHRQGRASAPVAAVQPTAVVIAPVPLAAQALSVAWPAAVPTALPTAIPTALPAAIPTAPPAAIPTALPTAVASADPPLVPTAAPTTVPTAADEWQRLQPALDRAWGTDTGATVQLLDGFLARHPSFELAREKLYAALLAEALVRLDQGAEEEAVESLERAALLLPTRAEAPAQLRALTPTPPIAVAPPGPPSGTTRAEVPSGRAAAPPKPVVRQAAAPVARNPAPPPTLPTPTKAPFRPPAP